MSQTAAPVTSQRPTAQQLRELYLAYRTLRAATSWNHLPTYRPLVISDADIRRTGYLATHKHRSTVAYYHGRTGLRAYLNAHQGLPFNQQSLVAFLQPEQLINPVEREQISNLGVHLRQGRPWPIFRSIINFHHEWPPNAQQTEAFTRALRMATECIHFMIDEHTTPPAPPDAELPALAPVWTVEQDRGRLSWHPLPSLTSTEPRVGILEHELLNRARTLARVDETWQIGPMPTPFSFYEDFNQMQRPHQAVITSVSTDADPPKRLSLTDLERHTDQRIQAVLMQCMLNIGHRPAVIETYHPTVLDVYRPLARELDFTLRTVADLPFDAEPMMSFIDAISKAAPQTPAPLRYPPTLPGDESPHQTAARQDAAMTERPLERNHAMAALLPARYYHPGRPVPGSAPTAAAATDEAPVSTYHGNSPKQALYRIARQQADPVDLMKATQQIIQEGCSRSKSAHNVHRNLRNHVLHDPRWQPQPEGTFHLVE